MSAENVELVQRAYAAFASGDLEALSRLIDPEGAIEDHDKALDSPSSGRGLNGLIEMVARANDGLEDVRYTPERFTGHGDRVMVDVQRTARGAASGATVEERQFHLVDVAGGRIVRLRNFIDRGAAIAAGESAEST